MVLGDTAFDAKAIRTACEECKFSWIVPINPERVLAGEKPRPKVSSLSEDLTADQMVCLKVHPGKGEVRRLSTDLPLPDRAEIQAPHVLRARGKSRRSFRRKGTALLFDNESTGTRPSGRGSENPHDQNNDAKLILRDVIELYQLRWQIELFFKELKLTLGLHHYRFKKFEKAETWVTLCLVTSAYLEWIRGAEIETESAREEREGVVANSANLRIGPGRASGSRTARTEATGGEDEDTHRV